MVSQETGLLYTSRLVRPFLTAEGINPWYLMNSLLDGRVPVNKSKQLMRYFKHVRLYSILGDTKASVLSVVKIMLQVNSP